MPKSKTQPKVKYVQVTTPDKSTLDKVFNHLFDKFLKQYKDQKSKQD